MYSYSRTLRYVPCNSLDILCHQHLRIFASHFAGLYNNISGNLIQHRLKNLYRSPLPIDRFRVENPDWFRKTLRPESDADYLVVYRYPSIYPPPFHINPQLIFTRFAGTQAWQTWRSEE